jgi:hypothetical protein
MNRTSLELGTPAIATKVPTKMIRRWERLFGYERFWREGKLAYLLTEHPNALPTSWRCPG